MIEKIFEGSNREERRTTGNLRQQRFYKGPCQLNQQFNMAE
jgi:hypothetical protein